MLLLLQYCFRGEGGRKYQVSRILHLIVSVILEWEWMSEDCCLKILSKPFFLLPIVLSLTYSNKLTSLTYDVTMTSSWIKKCDFTMIIENTTEFVFVRKLYILYIIYNFCFKTIAHFSVTSKKQSRTFILNSIDNIMNSIYKRVAIIAKRRKELLRYCIYFTNNFP